MHQEPTIDIGKNEEVQVLSVEHTTKTSLEIDTAGAETGPGTKSKKNDPKSRKSSDQKQTHSRSNKTVFWTPQGSSKKLISTSKQHKKQPLISKTLTLPLASSPSQGSATRAISTF